MTEPPYRVLYVESAEDGTVGGSHQALYDLVRKLDPARFEPVVLFYESNHFVQKLDEIDVETVVFDAERDRELRALRSRSTFGSYWEMLCMIGRRKRLLRERDVDLLHLNNCPTVGCDDWLPAAMLARIPSVASCMGLARTPRHPLRRLLVRQYDRVIPVSRHVAADLRGAGFPSDLITTIHHGIDLDELRSGIDRPPADVRANLDASREEVLVVMVGNVRRWKGQHVLLAALEQLESEVRRELKVAFAGGAGPEHRAYERELRNTVREAGLEGVVAFLGYRDDVPDLLNASDVAVHASTEAEPGGITVLEAMAFGTAVVAAERGGHTEVLTEECGIHFDTGQPSELASALTRLVRDPDLRRRLGSRAKSRVEQFSLDVNVRKTEEIYGRILDADRPQNRSSRRAEAADD